MQPLSPHDPNFVHRNIYLVPSANDDTSNTARAGGPLSTTAHEAECDPNKSFDRVYVYVN
jgi:hypothetical protein